MYASKRTLNIFYVLTWLWSVLCVSYTQNNTNSKAICDTARRRYKSAGFIDDGILQSTILIGNRLKICQKQNTCCTHIAESNLVNYSKKRMKEHLDPIKNQLQQAFTNNSQVFRSHFTKLIKDSENNLDRLFRETYASRYSNNTQMFKALYTAMHQYMNGSELNLKTTVEEFFANLFEKVFEMSRPYTTFNKDYKTCIHDSTAHIKPFGRHADHIAMQTVRTFFASRVFLTGLKIGMGTANKLLSLPITTECTKKLTEMSACQMCTTEQPTRACRNYCSNVVNGCFKHNILINNKWKSYLQDMIKLVDKLQGPYSMQDTIGPLGVRISDAIMQFQTNQKNITIMVEKRCGAVQISPQFNQRAGGAGSRQKRDAGNKKTLDGLKMAKKGKRELPSFLNNYNQEKNNQHSNPAEKLAMSAKTSLEAMKRFWVDLADNMCDSPGVSTSKGVNKNCWNGRNSSGYGKPPVSSESMEDLFIKNPEMAPEVSRVDDLKASNQLQTIRNLLQNAINGNDKQTSVDEVEGSGSGEEVEEGSGVKEGSGCSDGEDDEGSGNCDNVGSGDRKPSTEIPLPTSATTESNEVEHEVKTLPPMISTDDPGVTTEINNEIPGIGDFNREIEGGPNDVSRSYSRSLDANSSALPSRVASLTNAVLMLASFTVTAIFQVACAQ